MKKRPYYRSMSALLATQLLNFLEKADKEIPQILTKWEEAKKKDRLPEVKSAGF
jgi:hypothetical protein